MSPRDASADQDVSNCLAPCATPCAPIPDSRQTRRQAKPKPRLVKSLVDDGNGRHARGALVSKAATLSHEFRFRRAGLADLAALTAVMDAAIGDLQRGFLSGDEIAASRMIMGLDSALIEDGTYLIVEAGAEIAGCGGWSRRATLYGGDHTPGRDARRLDPATEPARVRAMYTAPAFARRGVGRLILERCHAEAHHNGFGRVELVATMAGEPLYRACGYAPIERFHDERGGAPVPLVRMDRALP